MEAIAPPKKEQQGKFAAIIPEAFLVEESEQLVISGHAQPLIIIRDKVKSSYWINCDSSTIDYIGFNTIVV